MTGENEQIMQEQRDDNEKLKGGFYHGNLVIF